MRIRLKTRAILAYLSTVCCLSIFFGLYFLLSPPLPAGKSRNGIERAAKDSWSGIRGHARHLGPLLYRGEIQRAGLLSFLYKERAEQQAAAKKEQQDSQQHVLPVPQSEIILPQKSKLLNMSWEELSNVYHSYTQHVQITCSSIQRLGKVTDGGWEVCEDKPYLPASPCLVYSFGVGDDFSFDDAAAKRYGCEVHSFDPSMKSGDHTRPSSVHFHAVGLADISSQTSAGWKMSTLPEIRQSLGHTQKALTILKLDIEEWEWKVLPSLLKGGHLNDAQQLLMELHQCDGCAQYNPDQIDKEPPKDRYITALSILKDLYDLGFRIFWNHQNRACSYLSKFGLTERNACCELHLVRTDQKSHV